MRGEKRGEIRPVGTISHEVMRNRMRRQDATPSGRSRITLPDLSRKSKPDILPPSLLYHRQTLRLEMLEKQQ
jgi:hypothetical protein